MSWSISAGGTKASTKQAVQEQARYPIIPTVVEVCSSPEEELREHARGLLLAAIAAQPDNASISISAYGSASSSYDDAGKLRTVQSLNISVSSS